jgi:hypothetical protein
MPINIFIESKNWDAYFLWHLTVRSKNGIRGPDSGGIMIISISFKTNIMVMIKVSRSNSIHDIILFNFFKRRININIMYTV